MVLHSRERQQSVRCVASPGCVSCVALWVRLGVGDSSTDFGPPSLVDTATLRLLELKKDQARLPTPSDRSFEFAAVPILANASVLRARASYLPAMISICRQNSGLRSRAATARASSAILRQTLNCSIGFIIGS